MNCYLLGATGGRPALAVRQKQSVAARLVFRKSFKKVLLSSGVYIILKYLSAYLHIAVTNFLDVG